MDSGTDGARVDSGPGTDGGTDAGPGTDGGTDAGPGMDSGPTDGGGSFMCTADDRTYLEENAEDVAMDSQTCGVSCATGACAGGCDEAMFQDCFNPCFEEAAMDPFDPPGDCVNCLSNRVRCVAVNCLAECIGGATMPACIMCQCMEGCQADFDTCAGTDTETRDCSG